MADEEKSNDEHPSSSEIGDIADQLEAEGLNVDELRALQDEMEVIEKPPGFFRRMGRKALGAAKSQWTHFVGELKESQEAMGLISQKLSGDRDLTPEEEDKVKAQLLDLVRVFPAGVIAAANSALPVPGTSVFTPLILSKLGLMPSRWREAHLLDQLQKQQDLLRRTGHGAEASKLGILRDKIEHDAERRDEIAREANVLTHWDANKNGVWDPEEREAYKKEVKKMSKLVSKHAARKRWFMEHEGEVFGPNRISEIDLDHSGSLLICYDGSTGWVALSDVLEP
jgi:hypothetical protein